MIMDIYSLKKWYVEFINDNKMIDLIFASYNFTSIHVDPKTNYHQIRNHILFRLYNRRYILGNVYAKKEKICSLKVRKRIFNPQGTEWTKL